MAGQFNGQRGVSRTELAATTPSACLDGSFTIPITRIAPRSSFHYSGQSFCGHSATTLAGDTTAQSFPHSSSFLFFFANQFAGTSFPVNHQSNKRPNIGSVRRRMGRFSHAQSQQHKSFSSEFCREDLRSSYVETMTLLFNNSSLP